jgi:hypothetical protein
MSGFGRGEKAPGRRMTSSYPSVAARLHCTTCEQEHPVYGIIIRTTPQGRRVPLCYDCYQQETDGVWHDQDEYWDGYRWSPLSKGK